MTERLIITLERFARDFERVREVTAARFAELEARISGRTGE